MIKNKINAITEIYLDETCNVIVYLWKPVYLKNMIVFYRNKCQMLYDELFEFSN